MNIREATECDIYRAIDLLKRIKREDIPERYIDRHNAFDLGIQALEVIEQYLALGTKDELEAAKRFKQYFNCLYGEGLEVANWHENGDLESFDNFYDSACEHAKCVPPKPAKTIEAKFFAKADELVEKFNISRDTACCFICNFEDDYICKRFNGGCKNRKLCREIYLKQLEESDF